jgi:hypothetical protein
VFCGLLCLFGSLSPVSIFKGRLLRFAWALKSPVRGFHRFPSLVLEGHRLEGLNPTTAFASFGPYFCRAKYLYFSIHIGFYYSKIICGVLEDDGLREA